ncbi:MAG TPA: hypothetical protein PLV92_27940, partial [Pirellulaceae bacterium]|nr:hypothetical protein [Pirellulaceae bacterium]
SATFELVTDPLKLLTVVDDENDDDMEAGPKVESSPKSGSQQESSGDQKSPQEQSQEQPPWQELYAELRATISVDLKRLAQTNPQFVEQLKPALESAKTLHGKGEFQQAFERLNKVSSILAAQAALARNDQVAQERPGKEKVREAGDAIELSQLNKILAELADAWARARARLVEQLRAAERELLAVCIGQPNFEEVVAKSPRLYEVASELDLRLSERLGQASAAKEDMPAFIRATQRCLDVIAEYRKFVSTDPKLAALKGATAELKINDLPELMNKTLTVLKTKVEFVKNAAEERAQRA